MSVKVTMLRGPNLKPIVFEDPTMVRASQRVDALIYLHALCYEDIKSEGNTITVDATRYYNKSATKEKHHG